MAIVANHLTTDGGTSGTSWNTDTISPTANALVLCWVWTSTTLSEGEEPTISGGGMTTWTKVGDSINHSASDPTLTLFRAMDGSPGSAAITITTGAVQDRVGWTVAEFMNVHQSGTNGSGAIVQSVEDESTGTSCTVTLASFADATNNMAVGGFGARITSITWTVGSGFTELGSYGAPSTPNAIMSEYQAGEDTSVDASHDGAAVPMLGIAVEIKSAPISVVRYVNCSAVDSNGNGQTNVTSSGDNTHAFSSLSGSLVALSSSYGDLVTDNNKLTIICDCGVSDVTDNQTAYVIGFNTDADNYITIQANTDNNRQAQVPWADSNVYRLESGDYFGTLSVQTNYTIVNYLQAGNTDTSNVIRSGMITQNNTVGVVANRCYFRTGLSNNTVESVRLVGTSDGLTLNNCVLVNRSTGASSRGINKAEGGSSLTLNNCSIISSASVGTGVQTAGPSNLVANNTVTYGFPTAWSDTTNWTGGNNASDTSDVPDVGTPLANIPNPFIDSGSDFHLKENSILAGAGIDMGGSYTTDFEGSPRPAWDIGALAFPWRVATGMSSSVNLDSLS